MSMLYFLFVHSLPVYDLHMKKLYDPLTELYGRYIEAAMRRGEANRGREREKEGEVKK